MSSYRLLLFLFCLASVPLHAQDQLGLRLDNYAGISGVTLNPASMVGSPLRWDLRLGGGGLFVDNNYAYFRNTNLQSAIGQIGNINVAPALSPEPVPADGLAMDFYTSDKRHVGYANAVIMGPAFGLNLGDQSFGVYTKLRAAAGARRVPSSLGYYNLTQIADQEQLTLTPFQAAGMVWGELGFSYARKVNDDLAFGGTLKYLQGYEGVMIRNHRSTELTAEAGDVVAVDNFDYTFAFATDYLQQSNATFGQLMQSQGAGLGIDLGATYQLNEQLKVGASLMDIGFVRFGLNTQFNRFEARDTFQITAAEQADVEGLLGAVEFLNSKVIARNHSSRQSENFAMWLPAGLSLQADYAVTNNFFVNAVMIRRLPTPGVGVKRANLMAVTPRFESQWFGVSAPLVWYDDRDLRMGLAVRMGPLTVGSDNLSG
ncbi:MAG: DUF5723 family protein, partial [Bacteroidota bacterium]